MHTHRTLSYLISALVLLSTAALLSCLLTGCGKSEAEAVVTRRTVTAYTTLDGEAAAPAAAEASILPPYRAPVDKVLVTIGQNVKEGDVLMQLSAPSSVAYYQNARVRVQQARQSLARAQARYGAQLRAARRDLEQARAQERAVRASLKAAQSGAAVTVTGADLDDAIARRQAAEQAVIDAEAVMETALVPYQRYLANAQQELLDAQAGVKAASIRTPITGTVLSIDAKPGDEVDPDNKKPVARVVNLDALQVYAAVDDRHIRHLKPGSPATISFSDVPGESFSGSLRNIYSKQAGFLRGVEHTAVFDFTNREGMAKPGMKALVRVKVGEARDALVVPSSAVTEEGGNKIVKLKEGGRWRSRVVETGISDGKYTVIRSGLKEGDVVKAKP